MGMDKELKEINQRVFDPERDNNYSYNAKHSQLGSVASQQKSKGVNFASVASNNVLRL
jgi:pyridoxine/pyridoxamine 5'-phosphate oxidase